MALMPKMSPKSMEYHAEIFWDGKKMDALEKREEWSHFIVEWSYNCTKKLTKNRYQPKMRLEIKRRN